MASSVTSLSDAVESFLADLAVGRSPRTVRTYRSALVRFTRFVSARLSDPNPPVSALAIDHAVDFARHLRRENPNLPKATLFTYTSAVSRFYAYLVREDLRPDLPLPKLQARLAALRGRRDRALPRVPSDEVVEAIVAAARAVPPQGDRRLELQRLRNVALVEVLRGSGLRVSEAAGLRRGDLDRAVRGARVQGKGRKERMVYFTPAAWQALEAYFAARGDGARQRAVGSLPVFARHDRAAGPRLAPLTTNGIRNVVYGLAKAVGLEEVGLTPHRFRAWFATFLVDETGDLAAVQDLLGHESADTTRVYTRVRAARLRELHDLAFRRHTTPLPSRERLPS
ncbi:MAG TPA: tyrosine-type recombinase/integrase [Chloroflexota bacterium]